MPSARSSIAVVVGLVRRSRATRAASVAGDSPNTVAQWTEGETTRLLSSAELPGLYLLRPRFLTKAENVVYLLLKAAFPRHEIFARVRLADVLQVKIGPQGMERLRAFRKIANQHVGFVVCDRDMTILAIVDAKEPDRSSIRATRSSRSSSSAACRRRRSSTSASTRRSCRAIASCASRSSVRRRIWSDAAAHPRRLEIRLGWARIAARRHPPAS